MDKTINAICFGVCLMCFIAAIVMEKDAFTIAVAFLGAAVNLLVCFQSEEE